MLAAILTQSWGADFAIAGTIVGMFGTIMVQLRAARKSRRDELEAVINEVISQKATSNKVEISPNPLMVKLQEDFVTRASFHKHAELNREAHEKLERKIESDVNKLQDSHNHLAREVSGMGSTVDGSAARLVLVDQKIDRLLENSSRRQEGDAR